MKKVVFLFISLLTFIACTDSNDNVALIDDIAVFNDTTIINLPKETPSLSIHEGLISQKADTFRITRNGETIAIVRLGEPIMIAQAEEREDWGYFQFPSLYQSDNGIIIAGWSMKEDAYTAYGEKTDGFRMSRDGGKTWEKLDRDYFMKARSGVELENGDFLNYDTPISKDINDYPTFPEPVNQDPIAGYNFYFESELPLDLRGVYLEYWDRQSGKIINKHSTLKDIELLRYTIDGFMPVVWWGEIKKEKEGSLIAGVYGGFYQNTEGDVLRTGISFYRSNDIGNSWSLVGKIPYQPDGKFYYFDGNDGFTEPTFEILNDGTYMCVMRTGSTTPMYRSFSKDEGLNWSIPEPFTPNGVKPNLLLLGNGTLILSSGRPGLQIRFCIDGDGKIWTEPVEMMPFIDNEGRYDLYGLTCGYSSILKKNDDTFYLVYSNFKIKNRNGEDRKAILFRKIEVIKKHS